MEITQSRLKNDKRWMAMWKKNIGFRFFYNPEYFQALYTHQSNGKELRDTNLDVRTQTADNDVMKCFYQQTKDKKEIFKVKNYIFFAFHQFLSYQYNEVRNLFISMIPEEGREYVDAILKDLQNGVFTKFDIYDKNRCNFYNPLMTKVYYRF